jgi:DNA-3-methyladenine glycosylase II
MKKMTSWQKHLAKDLKFKALLKLEIKIPHQQKNMGMKLINSILSQQLSTHVAKIMQERFLELFEGKKPTPEMILKIPLERIREIGISRPKSQYIHNVAQFILDHKVTDQKLHKMQDEEIIELLTKIKGVGRWTVEMLLIFGLAREDIFAIDDLGLQKAAQKLYGLHRFQGKELKEKISKRSLKWSPYRSYASLYLWRSLI